MKHMMKTTYIINNIVVSYNDYDTRLKLGTESCHLEMTELNTLINALCEARDKLILELGSQQLEMFNDKIMGTPS